MLNRVVVGTVVAGLLMVGLSVPAAAIGSTGVSGWATTAASAAVGYTIKDAVSVKTGSGYVARSLSVQRRSSTSTTWTTVGTGSTSSTGIHGRLHGAGQGGVVLPAVRASYGDGRGSYHQYTQGHGDRGLGHGSLGVGDHGC